MNETDRPTTKYGTDKLRAMRANHPSSEFRRLVVPMLDFSRLADRYEWDESAPLSEEQQGGMGVVRLARHLKYGVRVVIKCPQRGAGAETDLIVARFTKERDFLRKLHGHAAIVAYFDGGDEDGVPWYAMEYVENGIHITDWCSQKLRWPDKLEPFIQVCHGLAFAHARLVVHRDLKPANVLVTPLPDGSPAVKIIDWGIARDISDSASLAPGTPYLVGYSRGYASPEQMEGREVLAPSDVFSLGVMLYKMVAGAMPPEAASADEPARSTSTGTDLDWIIRRTLRRLPEARYESAASLARDLRRFLARQCVEARPYTLGYAAIRFVQRHWLVVLLFFSIVSGSIVSIWQRQEAVVARHEAELARDDAQEQRNAALQQKSAAEAARDEASAQRLLAEQEKQKALAARDAESQARLAAEAARKTADTARLTAEGLINDIIYDLRDRLDAVNQAGVLKHPAEQAISYFEKLDERQDTDEQQRNRAAAYHNAGLIAVAEGDYAKALKLFTEFHRHLEKRAQKYPSVASVHSDLAQATDRIGLAYQLLEDWPKAKAWYQSAFDRLQAREAPPDLLAIAHERLGDVAMHEAQPALALPNYSAAVAIWLRLADGKRSSRHLAGSLAKQASARGDLGQWKEAQEGLLQERRLLEQMLASSPLDVRLRRSLSLNGRTLASSAASLGKGSAEAATAAFERAIQWGNAAAQSALELARDYPALSQLQTEAAAAVVETAHLRQHYVTETLQAYATTLPPLETGQRLLREIERAIADLNTLGSERRHTSESEQLMKTLQLQLPHLQKLAQSKP